MAEINRVASAVLKKADLLVSLTYALTVFFQDNSDFFDEDAIVAFCSSGPVGRDLAKVIRDWPEFNPLQPFEDEAIRFFNMTVEKGVCQ